MEPLFKIRNLKKIYRMGHEKIYALNGIDLDIYQGEVLCLLGKSGSGKSTLLNMLAGLEKPSSGEIIVKNIHLEKLSENDVTKFRQLNVGFVFQSYNLIPTMSAIENVSLSLVFKGTPKSERIKKAKRILNIVGLGDRLYHKPSEMSGGQQQRVSIARAFVDNPKIVFADEPTGNLDSKTTFDIMDLMTTMAHKHKQTLIIVTHDSETAVYADRIVYIKDGRVEKVEVNENVKRVDFDLKEKEEKTDEK